MRFEPARDLLAALHHQSIAMVRKQGEIDCRALAGLLEASLDDLHSRSDTLAFLAGYLSRCLQGAAPDYTNWKPPS